MPLALLVAFNAPAGINARSGNYYISYDDLFVGGEGTLLKIQRTYNSRAGFVGMFGVGWGTPYETYLELQPDGVILLHEHGAGTENEFVVPALAEDDVDALILRMVEAARRGRYREPAAFDAWVASLADWTVRSREWRRLVSEGHLPPLRYPTGTRLRSTWIPGQYLVVLEDGYARFRTQGVDHFDVEGRLVRHTRRDGARLDLIRDDAGRITHMADHQGATIRLFYDEAGRVTRAEGPNGEAATYAYVDARLVQSRDTGGNLYVYDYDGRHNLLRIGYVDGTEQAMSYLPVETFEMVRYVLGADNEQTHLSYFGDDLRYGSEKRIVKADGKTSLQRDEYVFVRTPDGRRRTVQSTQVRDGRTVVFHFDDEEQLVAWVENGRRTTYARAPSSTPSHTRYVYETEGQTWYTDHRAPLRSHEKLWRIIRAPDQLEVELGYDDDGKLLWAEDGEGNRLHLGYDDKGRVHRLRGRGLDVHLTWAEDKRTLRPVARGERAQVRRAAAELTRLLEPVRVRQGALCACDVRLWVSEEAVGLLNELAQQGLVEQP